MPFTNPLVAGTSLIRTAIHSPNYVAGVSGWSINKDGSAEFNNVTSRGTLIVGGTLTDPAGSVRVQTEPTFGAIIYLNPVDSTIPGDTYFAARLFAARLVNVSGSDETPYVKLESPFENAPSTLHTSQIILWGQQTTSGTDNSFVELIGSKTQVDGNLTVAGTTTFTGKAFDPNSHTYMRGENGAFLASWTTLDSVTFAVTFAHTFTNPPQVQTNIETNAGTTTRWSSRAYGVTTTGFTFWLYAPTSGATSSGSNVRLTWSANEYT